MSKPLINEAITAKEVLLIQEDGVSQGVIALSSAILYAKQEGLDLVQVNKERVPTCRVMDYARKSFQKKKKSKQSTRKVKMKEIKLRPNITDHDLNTKFNSMEKFFGKGDRVKISVNFRGREISHIDKGNVLIEKVKERFADMNIDSEAKKEGRSITMVMSP